MEKEKEEAKLADEARKQWLAEEVRKAAEEAEKERKVAEEAEKERKVAEEEEKERIEAEEKRKAAEEAVIQTTETSSQESTSTYYTAYDSEYFSQQK